MQELYFWQTRDPGECAQVAAAEDILVECLAQPPGSEMSESILHSTSQQFVHSPVYTFFHLPAKFVLRFRHRHRPQGKCFSCLHPSIRATKLLTQVPNYTLSI